MKSINKIVIFAITVLLSVLAVTSSANVIYKVHEAMETDIKIQYKWSDDLTTPLNYTNPFVVIDGVTYVPLRETMDMFNIGVEWDGETREITLHDHTYYYLEREEIFNKLFGCSLPEGAVFDNATPSYDGWDHELNAKYAIDDVTDESLELFKENLITAGFHMCSEEEKAMEQEYGGVFRLQNDNLTWWKLKNVEDTDELYHDISTGVLKMTIEKYVAFTVEDGKKYVYITYS